MSAWSWYKFGEAIAFFVGGFLIALAAKFLKKLRRKPHKWEGFEFHRLNRTDIQLVELLSSLRVEANGDRTHLHRFHNGGEFAGGEPIKKFSCTHESVAIGVSHEIENEQNVLCSMIPRIFEMLTEQAGDIMLVEKEIDNSFLRSYLDAQNVKASAIAPLFMQSNSGRYIVGFISIDYTDLDHVPKNEYGKRLEKLTILEDYARLIERELLKG